MSPKKIAFFAIVAVLIVAMGIGISYLSKTKKTQTGKGPKDLSVWVVGDDTAGFDDLVKAFKSSDSAYKDTAIAFTKFATYGDYEKTLLNVIADGNSPDIFVVPSGGAAILEPKTEYLPDSIVNVDAFSKTYNPLFDSLVVLGNENDSEGKQSRFVKGIPMGYETMAAFYNRALVSGAVPATWEEFKEYVNGAGGGDFVPAALGLGSRYVPGAPSIVSLFLVQRGIAAYAGLSEANAEKALSDYQSYRGGTGTDGVSHGLADIRSDMDQLGIGSVDMFVRGKVGIIFGFPSILRDIAYATKRAWSDASLEKKDLRSSEVPQMSGAKKANLARYNYFALSKTAPHQDAAVDFLRYLNTKEAQELYLESFSQYLPARNELLADRKERRMSKDYPWVRYENFVGSPDTELVSFDRGIVSEFESAFGRELDTNADARTILTNVGRLVECQKKHLVDGSGYEEACGEPTE